MQRSHQTSKLIYLILFSTLHSTAYEQCISDITELND